MARSSSGESVLTRVHRILSCFDADTPSLSISDIARRVDLPVATAHRLVGELTELGFLERSEDRRVHVGLRLWELGSRGSRAVGLRQAAMPFMEDLHSVVRQHTQLAVLDGLESLFLERLSAQQDVANIIQIAGRLPAHACSSGLILLAHAPVETQESVLVSKLKRYTDRTVTDSAQLRRLLAEVRRQGFVVADGLITKGATGVAVPIRDGRDRVIAALNIVVSSAEGRATSQVSALLAAARGISRAMGFRSGVEADLVRG